MSNAAKKSAPASITKAEVVSNKDPQKTASLVNGILRLTYHESILQDSIKAYIVFSDVGNAVDGKSVVEGLPLIGTEDCKLVFEDNNDKKIDNIINEFLKVLPLIKATGAISIIPSCIFFSTVSKGIISYKAS